MKPPEPTAAVPSSEPAHDSLEFQTSRAAELVNSELGTHDAPIHDCWKVIGVEGNRTCRELLKFTHCRNCPVYSAAATKMLDRPLPSDYRRERAKHYAQQKKLTPATRLSVVIFRLGDEWLALPTTVFQEVAEQRAIHSLPHRRGGLVLGLVNVRGELLVCAAAAQLLGLETEVRGRRSEVRVPASGLRPLTSEFARLLVTSWNGQRLAFPVDEVHGIHHFPSDELKAPPAPGGVAAARLYAATISHPERVPSYTQGVFGWRDRTVGLLDADSLFTALNRGLA